MENFHDGNIIGGIKLFKDISTQGANEFSIKELKQIIKVLKARISDKSQKRKRSNSK